MPFQNSFLSAKAVSHWEATRTARERSARAARPLGEDADAQPIRMNFPAQIESAPLRAKAVIGSSDYVREQLKELRERQDK